MSKPSVSERQICEHFTYLPLQKEDVHDGQERTRTIAALGDDGGPFSLPGDPFDTVEI